MSEKPPVEVRLADAISRGGWSVCLASGFYVGFAPFASGTFGALLGLPLAWLIAMIPGLAWQAVVVVAICLVGIPLSTAAARRLGDLKDPGFVVFDEIASLPITFFGVAGAFERWEIVALGFALHRVFDISKPPPARQLEQLPRGLGIMADDWAAGVYSNLALQGILWTGLLDRLAI